MRNVAEIALLGCGTVGAGVAQMLLARRDAITQRTGIAYTLRGIAVSSVDKERPHGIPRDLLTENAAQLASDPHVDVVVECIGGRDVAAEFVEGALERRKCVVTANKDLVAGDGPRLHALAYASGVSLRYEAAVCGGVPIVRALADSLAGDEIDEIDGILNGTTNFILDEMHEGASYDDALREAQRRGFAETDPTSDVEGFDAANKLAILAQVGLRCALTPQRIARRGITGVHPGDVLRAQRAGYRIKLLGRVKRNGESLEAQVAPVFVPQRHPFAQTHGAQNCVRISGRSSGSLWFAGAGAGREPSAAAMVGDVVATLRDLAAGRAAAHRDVFHPVRTVTATFDTLERAVSGATTYPLWPREVPARSRVA